VNRLICLAGGAFVGDGDPTTVLADPAVREVFLGTDVTAALAAGVLLNNGGRGEASRLARDAGATADSPGADPLRKPETS
jgi:hypothetical protein